MRTANYSQSHRPQRWRQAAVAAVVDGSSELEVFELIADFVAVAAARGDEAACDDRCPVVRRMQPREADAQRRSQHCERRR